MIKKNRISATLKLGLKITFLLLITSILVVVIWMNNSLVMQIVDRETEQLQTFASIYREYTLSEDEEDAERFLESITPTLYFPLIITDIDEEPFQDYLSFTLNIPQIENLHIEEQREYLVNLISKMKSKYPPILIYDKNGEIISKFFYSHSQLVDLLTYFPVFSTILIITIIILSYFAYNSSRNNEQSRVYVGMARETAHQLGTPISSLLAWIELLKINKDYPDAITDTANEIEHDINRLSTIASRFAKIGSEPILAPINISKKIDEVIEYYEIRLPHYAGKVKINKNYSDQIIINANDTLIGWVFENIIKNAVEALEGKKGTITISVNTESNKRISVLVSDTGKGMTTKMKLHIFEPGFTTKARGWGIGLNLVKRIVEDYHKGRIYVKSTTPGKGTTFAIELNY